MVLSMICVYLDTLDSERKIQEDMQRKAAALEADQRRLQEEEKRREELRR